VRYFPVSVKYRFWETNCVKSHRLHDLLGAVVKGAHSRMRDDGHFLQLSLTILKFVTVM
jgi:hypothetical protein